MSMYSESIKPKIDEMFAGLLNEVLRIAEVSSSREEAANKIIQKVGRETAKRSGTMFTDMYTALSKDFLKNRDTAFKQKFYRAALDDEILEKYSFAPPEEGLDYKKAIRTFKSIGISAGITVGSAGLVAALGKILKYALRNKLVVIPVPVIIAAAVAVGLILLFSTRSKVNKFVFKQSVKDYIMTVKREYISWLDEVENYFKKRAKEVCG